MAIVDVVTTALLPVAGVEPSSGDEGTAESSSPLTRRIPEVLAGSDVSAAVGGFVVTAFAVEFVTETAVEATSRGGIAELARVTARDFAHPEKAAAEASASSHGNTSFFTSESSLTPS
jgi:hypothetical protein